MHSPTKGPDERIDERRALIHLKKALARLGLPGHLHTFRHSFISYWLLQRTPEVIVRKWVGHVDSEIIKLYTHVIDEDSQRYMRGPTSDGRDEVNG